MLPRTMLVVIIALIGFVSCTDSQTSVQVSNPTSDLSWLKREIGPRLHIDGRDSNWDAAHKRLGDTKFIAHFGMVSYIDPKDGASYYSIDVEYPTSPSSSTVCFSHDFALAELPKDFDPKNSSNVDYDEVQRLVTFSVGPKTFAYTLPLPPK